ncbi:P22 phage major capsid protein family protein [Nonomuraea sp. CA-141351]|uniref:P22 phage major capsid protein family protein n=1 Tax=Nonomuraea sp. CA-141351 TaxID=3239996 RepID=UPI003D937759
MANTFLTPQVIARAALATLYETCVMAQLVHRDLDEDFAGKVGDTVNVRKPATFSAYEYDRSQGIQIQNATETAIPVTLNHFADVSFAVTAEEMTLEIQDFATQLLNPAMEAISQKIDNDLLALRDDVVQEVGNGGLPNLHTWDSPKSMIDADRVLNERNVPPSMRSVVVGPQIKANWLSDPLFHQLDVRGDTDGLREASLGRRVFGFDAFSTQNIKVPPQTSGNSKSEVGVAFHRTAFCLVTRPLVLPQGAANAVVANYKGFSLRVVMDYDIDLKQDVVSIDTLYGTKTLDANRAVLVKDVDVP